MSCEGRWTGRLAVRLARKRARRVNLGDILGSVSSLDGTERYRECLGSLWRSGGMMMGSV